MDQVRVEYGWLAQETRLLVRTFDFDLGFQVDKPIRPMGRVINGALPAARVARAVHTGPYDQLAQAWGELQQWVRDRKLGETGRFWERYLNNPDEVISPEEYRTELNWIISNQ